MVKPTSTLKLVNGKTGRGDWNGKMLKQKRPNIDANGKMEN